MSTATPWWSSGDADDLDPAQDPLDAHVAARGLGVVGDDDAAAGGAAGPGASGPGASGPDGAPGSGPGSGHDSRVDHGPLDDEHAAVCGVCPICRGHAALRATHPEVATHLAEAARHLALALSRIADVVDAARDDAATAGGGAGGGVGSGGGPAAFTDIPLDDVAPDDVAPDDVAPDDVPLDDVPLDDVPLDDVPDDRHDAP